MTREKSIENAEQELQLGRLFGSSSCSAFSILFSSPCRPLLSLLGPWGLSCNSSPFAVHFNPLLPSPNNVRMPAILRKVKEHHRQQLKKAYNRLQLLSQARPTMRCILQYILSKDSRPQHLKNSVNSYSSLLGGFEADQCKLRKLRRFGIPPCMSTLCLSNIIACD